MKGLRHGRRSTRMKESAHNFARRSELGGARVNLLIAAVAIFLISNAGYQYIPVAYQSENFRQDMQTAVVQGVSMPSTYGKPIEVIKGKISNAANLNELPPDVFIDVKEKNNVMTARVYYTRQIPLVPFGIYNYEFVFDNTVTPGGFLSEGD